jgi:hypothetical protein
MMITTVSPTPAVRIPPAIGYCSEGGIGLVINRLILRRVANGQPSHLRNNSQGVQLGRTFLYY